VVPPCYVIRILPVFLNIFCACKCINYCCCCCCSLIRRCWSKPFFRLYRRLSCFPPISFQFILRLFVTWGKLYGFSFCYPQLRGKPFRHSRLLLQGGCIILRVLKENSRSMWGGKHNTVTTKVETRLTFHSWSLL
jgi:hypothetical protein